jgi:hypothetical protein
MAASFMTTFKWLNIYFYHHMLQSRNKAFKTIKISFTNGDSTALRNKMAELYIHLQLVSISWFVLVLHE